jgi:hypothetical protein
MDMYFGTAVFALAFQQNIAEDRDIKIERQGFSTIGTMRSRQDNGLFFGQTVYPDIKKTA